jgi:serine/threonine-protein kinase
VDSSTEARRLIGDRYELEALIGKGGVGEVWRARHVALNSRVAIKFLQPASAQRESAKRRFTTEAQVTAQLRTPTAVQVFDFGITDDGQPYLVMELLEGETLGLRLQRVKRLAVADTARVLAQAARALQRAHQLGIIHRDFKPDNIVVFEDDEGREQVKVLDFGVAKLVGSLEEQAAPDGASGSSPSFTRTGAVLGTPLYMAPEQIRDATSVDPRVDIWAFGVVAFECLTGRPPFSGSNLLELFARIQSGLHPSANFLEPSVPAGFDAWFEIACAPDPAKRFPNATIAWKQLAVALEIAGGDSSPSLSGVLDPNAASGERRVLVVRDAQPVEPEGATVDAPAPSPPSAPSPGELRSRSHAGGFASLQRISLDELPAMATHAGPVTPAGRAAASGPPGSRGTWWMAGFAAVALLSGVAVWRVATLSPATAPSAASARAVPSVPVPPASARAPASGVPPEIATSATPPPLPAFATATASPTRTALPPTRLATHPALAAPSAAPPVPALTPAPALPPAPAPTLAPAPAPSPAPAPTSPAPSPTDPGSYR